MVRAGWYVKRKELKKTGTSWGLVYNGLHWRSTWEFVASLTSADDKLKRDVETTSEAKLKTVQPRTKPAILLMLKFQRPAPYFANALLPAALICHMFDNLRP